MRKKQTDVLKPLSFKAKICSDERSVSYLAVLKHIFSLGNSLGPSEPSHTWFSVSRYTSRHTHRRWIWLVRSWRPGRGPCSSPRKMFISLSIACKQKQRNLLQPVISGKYKHLRRSRPLTRRLSSVRPLRSPFHWRESEKRGATSGYRGFNATAASRRADGD